MTRWSRWLTARRAKREIELIARHYCPAAKVFKWRGGPGGQLSFCIETTTDKQRDRILEEPSVYQQFSDALLISGFPSDVVPSTHFRIESRETLDRDYGGSWCEAMEMP